MTVIQNPELIPAKRKAKQISRIVLTGGPCAGKTSALERFVRVAKAIPKLKVILCKEAATILKNSQMNFVDCGADSTFQELIISLQKTFEEAAFITAKKFLTTHPDYTIIILSDRGIMDGGAYYPTLNDFEHVLNTKGMDREMAYKRYDAVICMRSAAVGAPEFYTTADGTPREETPEEAAKLDEKCCAAWRAHPNYFEVDNSFKFYEKLDKVISLILKLAGLDVPKKICKRYLIEMPKVFDIHNRCKDIEICKDKTFFLRQTDPNTFIGIKIRRVGENATYYRTTQRWGMVKHPETHRNVEQAIYDSIFEITEKEMVHSLGDVDGQMNPLDKITYSFHLGNSVYCELDIYPNNEERAYLRAYLDSDTEENRETVNHFFKIVREVTYNKHFSEHEIARTGGKVLNTK